MNIEHTQQQINNLNKAYLNGQLDYAEYKNKRALTFDSMFDEITVRNIKVEKTATASHRVIKDTSNIYIYLAIAVLVVCLGLAVVFLINSSVFSVPPENKKIESVIVEKTPVPLSATIEVLVEKSLKENIWSISVVNDISAGWNKLTKDDRVKYRKSIWYPKLIDVLNGLMVEQKALVDLGNNEALVFENKIKQLIVDLNNDKL